MLHTFKLKTARISFVNLIGGVVPWRRLSYTGPLDPNHLL